MVRKLLTILTGCAATIALLPTVAQANPASDDPIAESSMPADSVDPAASKQPNDALLDAPLEDLLAMETSVAKKAPKSQ